MMAFSWSAKLGIVTFAPGLRSSASTSASSGHGGSRSRSRSGSWRATPTTSTLDGRQIGVRAGSLLVLAVGSALAGLPAAERACPPRSGRTAVRADRRHVRRHLPHGRGREILISNRPLRQLVGELGLPNQAPCRSACWRSRTRSSSRSGTGSGCSSSARAGRRLDRRVRGRRDGPRLPRVHRAGPGPSGGFEGRVGRSRGDGRPRARPDARRLRRDGLARAADAADLDLGLPRDDAGRGGGPRRRPAASIST